jgi:ADP-heptose:LPS heptosyltransferase
MLKKIYKNYLIWLKSHFAKKLRPLKKSKKILLFKGDKLGDFFIFLPHIQQLLKMGYEITLISAKFSKEIIDHLNIDLKYIEYKIDKISDINNILRQVKKADFDYAINFSMNVWGGIFVNNSKAFKKIALVQETEHYVYKGVNIFYDNIYSYNEKSKTIDTYTSVIQELIPDFNISYSINTKTDDKHFILIHPFAGWKPREWPYFSDLLTKKFNNKIKVIGTKDEFKNNDSYKEYEQIELDSISHLMTLIENCTAFIGNDSGPAHYSALLGKKTNVLWGPGNLDRIKPVGNNVNVMFKEISCRPCRQKGEICERGVNQCLLDLTLDEVEEKLIL